MSMEGDVAQEAEGTPLFRSQRMAYVQLHVTSHACSEAIRALGKFGKLHLIDLGAGSDVLTEEQMRYKRRAVECAKWERRLQFFEQQMDKHDVELPQTFPKDLESDFEDVLTAIQQFLVPKEEQIHSHLEVQRALLAEVNGLREKDHVLRLTQFELSGQDFAGLGELEDEKQEKPVIEMQRPERTRVVPAGEGWHNASDRFHHYLCGVLPVSHQASFERMVWRASRGNAFSRFFHVEEPMVEPSTGDEVFKSVFLVVCLASRKLEDKIRRIAGIAQATLYDIPPQVASFASERQDIALALEEREEVLMRTQHAVKQLLQGLAVDSTIGNSPLLDWQVALRKEKAVCDVYRKAVHFIKYITLEGWCPCNQLAALENAVKTKSARSGERSPVVVLRNPVGKPSGEVAAAGPPSHFETDKFTQLFQEIVNAYGVPRYLEANPGLFTIITFPFLFGIMYGDVGHGSALLFFALWLVFNESGLCQRQRAGRVGEFMGMLIHGRYLLLLMGFFSVFCGFIYNDCLSMPFTFFESNWLPEPGTTSLRSGDSPYPFGIDPAWHGVQNELAFFNSFKMKVSVSLGVVHMVMGIILSFFNHRFFRNPLRLWFEFLPQLVFMLCTFGYMIFLIVLKWTIDWREDNEVPPNLIQTMIGMFLEPGVVTDDTRVFDGQETVQMALLFLALLSVPVMLLGRPVTLWHRANTTPSRRHGGASYGLLQNEESEDEEAKAMEEGEHKSPEAATTPLDEEGEEKFDFSNEMVHSAIHTIEFVLGCVSNTASYLRLWALSLAHAELASVFWDKLVLQSGLETGSTVALTVSFGTWVLATIAVLLMMDALECFMHVLRLHWVEFQSKFYHADGFAFEPFNFDNARAVHPLAYE